MADPAIVYDVGGIPTFMNGLPFSPLQTLRNPSDIYGADTGPLREYILVMIRFLVADLGHDIIQNPGALFTNLHAHYIRSINALLPGRVPDNPERVERSTFKEYVTEQCRDAVAAAAGGAATARALPPVIAFQVPRFGVEGQIQQMFPLGAQQILRSLSTQHVDNYRFTMGRPLFNLPILITPARYYDMASKSDVLDIYTQLIEWWTGAVGLDAAGNPLPFFISLVDFGITTVANSYFMVGIENHNVGGVNSILVFVIKFGGIVKTIRYNLSQNRQQNSIMQTDDGSDLLVSGKNLAKCFFQKIFGQAVNLYSLSNIGCLQTKTMHGGQIKPRKKQTPAGSKKPIYRVNNLEKLVRLFTPATMEGHTTIGCILMIAKFLGDFSVMAMTPYEGSTVSTNDPMLCANDIIHRKHTLYSYTSTANTNNILYFQRSDAAITAIKTKVNNARVSGAAAAAADGRQAPTPGNDYLVAVPDVALPDVAIPDVAGPDVAKSKNKKITPGGIQGKNVKAKAKNVNGEITKRVIAILTNNSRGIPSRRAALISQELTAILMGREKRGGSQEGGAISPMRIFKDSELDESPSKIIESRGISSKNIAFVLNGKTLSLDKTLRDQGVKIKDTIYIVTNDQPAPHNHPNVEKGATEDTIKPNENNNYLMLISSFKGMLKEFIDNLAKVLISTHIKIESGDPVGYNISKDAPRFRERLSKVMGFYIVVSSIPNDELLKTLMQTNIFRALELITPVSPFIPIEGTNEFVFLLCPNWATSIYHSNEYLKKSKTFSDSLDTKYVETYVGENRNLHTAFIAELNSSLKKDTPIQVVSSRKEPTINSFENFLRKIIPIIAPYVKNHVAFYEEFGVTVAHMRELLGIEITIINDEPSSITPPISPSVSPPPVSPPHSSVGNSSTSKQSKHSHSSSSKRLLKRSSTHSSKRSSKQSSKDTHIEKEQQEQQEEEQEEEQEEGWENIYEDEEKSLKIKKIFNRIPQILSTLLACNILRETIELELLKALIVDSEENMYLIKSIHQLFKKTVNYYGTFICASDVVVSFVKGIDFHSNTLLFFGDYLRLYEYINIYDETKTQLIANNTYNSIETYLPLQEIYFITEEVLKDPNIESIKDAEYLDQPHIDTLIEKSVHQVMQQLEQLVTQEEKEEEEKSPKPLSIVREPVALPVGTRGGNNSRMSMSMSMSAPKHNAKYRKKYKKFVNKYIIKKKKNKNKNNTNNTKNNKNKTKKNKKLTKLKSRSKSTHHNKTVKNSKRKSNIKSKSNRKLKHNNKVNTNYYNLYKRSKTLKH